MIFIVIFLWSRSTSPFSSDILRHRFSFCAAAQSRFEKS